MTPVALQREIKKAVDRLTSLADYVTFLSRPTLLQRLEQAEKDITAGKGVNWRQVRSDV